MVSIALSLRKNSPVCSKQIAHILPRALQNWAVPASQKEMSWLIRETLLRFRLNLNFFASYDGELRKTCLLWKFKCIACRRKIPETSLLVTHSLLQFRPHQPSGKHSSQPSELCSGTTWESRNTLLFIELTTLFFDSRFLKASQSYEYTSKSSSIATLCSPLKPIP